MRAPFGVDGGEESGMSVLDDWMGYGSDRENKNRNEVDMILCVWICV